MRLKPLDRFWNFVTRQKNGCWEWTGGTNNGGYGNFWVNGKTVSAHRYAYQALRLEIPAGLTLDHLCRNKKCVNPDHLEPVTFLENTMRSDAASAVNARKTHCIRGHEFTPENTLVEGDGHRQCRICRRSSWRNFARKKRMAKC